MTCFALVVDDHEAIREVVADIVRSLGHEPVCVGTQQAALEALRLRRFCYVLLDLCIPVRERGEARPETGEVTLARLREEWPDVPVIVITASGEVRIAVNMMKTGAADFVTKPFATSGSETLEKKVPEVMRKHGCMRGTGGCANERPTTSGRASTSAPRPAPTLRFDGEITDRLVRVFVNERPCLLQEVVFRALGALAAGAVEGRGVPLEMVSPGIKNNYNVISRLRTALTKAGLPRDVISTDGHGTYRLEIPPANISVDRDAMKRHFSKLASQLVSGA